METDKYSNLRVLETDKSSNLKVLDDFDDDIVVWKTNLKPWPKMFRINSASFEGSVTIFSLCYSYTHIEFLS